jgi:DNA-binding FadR family transcriptional regulator
MELRLLVEPALAAKAAAQAEPNEIKALQRLHFFDLATGQAIRDEG